MRGTACTGGWGAKGVVARQRNVVCDRECRRPAELSGAQDVRFEGKERLVLRRWWCRVRARLFHAHANAVKPMRKERTCLVVASNTGARRRGTRGRQRVLAARRVVRCGRSAGRSGELFWGWFLGHIALPPPLPRSETTDKTRDWPNQRRTSLFLADDRRSLHGPRQRKGSRTGPSTAA
jgi:hypothetical protein